MRGSGCEIITNFGYTKFFSLLSMTSLLIRTLQRILPQSLWLAIRQRPIIQDHQRVADYWAPIIAQWEQGKLPHYTLRPKQDLPMGKVIWQYWGQGADAPDLPEVVRIGFASVDYFAGDYQVIRLSDTTVRDYIDLPEFVWEKMHTHKAFNRTFFSDLLRVALLATYGGVWLDATILLSAPLPEAYTTADFFAFQRDPNEQDQHLWRSTYYEYYGFKQDYRVRFLSSALFAKPNTPIIDALLDLLLFYWHNETVLNHYFCFQILFHELVQVGPLQEQNCPVVSDVLPHLIQKKIAQPHYQRYSWRQALQVNTIHKLSYFDEPSIEKLREVLGRELPELSLPERSSSARNPK